MDISSALEKIISRENLSIEQTRDLFLRMMSGHATEAQIAAILIAHRVKGECPEELAGAALVMRELSTKVEIDLPNLIDTCGTGGSVAASYSTFQRLQLSYVQAPEHILQSTAIEK